MADKINPIYELLEHAVQNYERAVQASLKVQEESTRWWTDLLAQPGMSPEWQKRLGNLSNEVFPLAQKRMEESIRLVEQAGRTSLDVFKQAMAVLKADPAAANQAKLQDLWAQAFEVLRNNAQAAAQMNAKVLDCWTQFAPRGAEAAPTPAAGAGPKSKAG